jgi:hypothetical protein
MIRRLEISKVPIDTSTPVTPIGFSAYNHWVNGKHLSAGINDASALAV